MGTIKTPKPVKYFCAITYSEHSLMPEVFRNLELIHSKIELKSDRFIFSQYTDYYGNEMGDKLEKIFVSFSELASPDKLPEYKIGSNKIEKEFLGSSGRKVNIDPGYLTEAKIVLATTKDYSHRLYLKNGIFGDVHLYFEDGSYNPQLWTYPDYKQSLSLQFFNQLRIRYREQLGQVM